MTHPTIIIFHICCEPFPFRFDTTIRFVFPWLWFCLSVTLHLLNSVVFFTSRKWGYIGNKTDDSFRLKFHPNTVRKSFRQGEIEIEFMFFHLTHPQTNPLNITTSHPPSISLIIGEVEIEFLASYEQMGIMEVTKCLPYPLHSHHTSLTTLIPLPVLAQVNITLSQGIPTGGKPSSHLVSLYFFCYNVGIRLPSDYFDYDGKILTGVKGFKHYADRPK